MSEKKNRGKLLADATCTPSDIKYPTDINLLNEVRKQTEKVIDILHKNRKNVLDKKPRTYRNLARKDYLSLAKKRKVKSKERRKAIKKQLQYIKRNLSQIDQLLDKNNNLTSLNKTDHKKLLVAREIYRQQQELFEEKKTSIAHRIVSLSQPHLRPIVRGKAGKTTEFGAKLTASCFYGYILLSHLSWDNFNEALWLETQIENYKELTGFYPESVHVDKIYRNRNNRKYCKDRNIRMSGPPLGRPPKNITKSMKQQSQKDERIRNEIEGKFGRGKRRFGLNQIMSKLSETAETEIAVAFLVMNLTTLLKRGYYLLFYIFTQHQRFFANSHYQYLYNRHTLINKNYAYFVFINLSKLFVFSFTYSANPN